MSQDPDVLVVGGGPAGSTVARLLALGGWEVLVVDRARFPRPKPCGECVNPGAVAVLERMDLLETVLGLAHCRLDGWRLRTTGVDMTAAFGGGRMGLGVSRQLLDDALLRAARRAGATVLEGAQVQHVEPAQRGDPRPFVTIRVDGHIRTVRPRLVVGADGLRSKVARSLGLSSRGPGARKVSVTVHVTGPGLPQTTGVMDVRDGFTLGVAPLGGDRWNVTLVADVNRDGHRLAGDPVALLADKLCARFPDFEWALADGPWVSGPFDAPVRRSWAPGVVLVGDAAGYFDPFTGQGIYRALRSAELASEAVRQTLEQPSGGWAHLVRYHHLWTREVRWRRAVQRGVDLIMARPALRAATLRRLAAAGGLAQVIRVIGDMASPASLLRPSVWVGTRR